MSVENHQLSAFSSINMERYACALMKLCGRWGSVIVYLPAQVMCATYII